MSWKVLETALSHLKISTASSACMGKLTITYAKKWANWMKEVLTWTRVNRMKNN